MGNETGKKPIEVVKNIVEKLTNKYSMYESLSQNIVNDLVKYFYRYDSYYNKFINFDNSDAASASAAESSALLLEYTFKKYYKRIILEENIPGNQTTTNNSNQSTSNTNNNNTVILKIFNKNHFEFFDSKTNSRIESKKTLKEIDTYLKLHPDIIDNIADFKVKANETAKQQFFQIGVKQAVETIKSIDRFNNFDEIFVNKVPLKGFIKNKLNKHSLYEYINKEAKTNDKKKVWSNVYTIIIFIILYVTLRYAIGEGFQTSVARAQTQGLQNKAPWQV